MGFRRLPFDFRPSDRTAIGLRQGDRGNAQHRPLHRAGDGARVGDVLGDVLAAVDARKDEIGRMVGHDFPDPHDDAVGRRAFQGEMARPDFPQPQRVAEGERMGDARLVVLGRDDGHVVRKLARDQFEELEPRCVDAVVIGEQDSHGAGFRTRRASRRAGSRRKRDSRRLRRYCGRGPSCGQPSALQMMGEN